MGFVQIIDCHTSKDEFGQKQQALLDGPMTFTDLDILTAEN